MSNQLPMQKLDLFRQKIIHGTSGQQGTQSNATTAASAVKTASNLRKPNSKTFQSKQRLVKSRRSWKFDLDSPLKMTRFIAQVTKDENKGNNTGQKRQNPEIKGSTQLNYKIKRNKSQNLNLGDYLKLYTLSRRSNSEKNRKSQRVKGVSSQLHKQNLKQKQSEIKTQKQQKKAQQLHQNLQKKHILKKSQTQFNRNQQILKRQTIQSQPCHLLQHQSSILGSRKSAIDTITSIKILRQDTLRRILQTKKQLSEFLKKLDNPQVVMQDQESLVFMCNVLHVFEDKIVDSAKFVQSLVEDRRKQKEKQRELREKQCQIQQLKKYSTDRSLNRKITKVCRKKGSKKQSFCSNCS